MGFDKHDTTFGFAIEGLTDLRYLMPLMIRLQQLNIVPYVFVHVTRVKYNGLSFDDILPLQRQNMNILLSLLNIYVPVCKFISKTEAEKINFDVLFGIEMQDTLYKIPHKKLIVVHHYLDYQTFARNMTDDYVATTKYVIWSKRCADDMDIKFPHIKKIIIPPITMSNYELSIATGLNVLKSLGRNDTQPVVTFYYPQSDLTHAVEKMYDALSAVGAFVVFKQRRKHGEIPKKFKNRVYDDVWFPSESIILPMLSTVCVCMGSGVYLELEEAGLRCVEYNVTEFSQHYLRGQNTESFYSSDDLDSCIDKAVEWSKLQLIKPNAASADDLDRVLFDHLNK